MSAKNIYCGSGKTPKGKTNGTFEEFLLDENLRDENPAIKIKLTSKRRSLPKLLSISEIDTILATAKSFGKNSYLKARNYALFELLYSTGMRVSELLSLPLASFLGNPTMLLIKGKGEHERLVPMSAKAKEATKLWLVERNKNEKNKDSRFLFPSNSKYGHLNREIFFKLVKQIAVCSKLDPKLISPHSMRDGEYSISVWEHPKNKTNMFLSPYKNVRNYTYKHEDI